ncbi:hypothetical protein EYF80_001985 [Liparis tanakae]|uniref:Uncharacterized protein n=1 Tax=Liparis tanakae TaxID=230148 RepID=A0A4Z2JDB0_9TELE|nr:hypothetical protein EYF80_001985 [Liparis tanakae]
MACSRNTWRRDSRFSHNPDMVCCGRVFPIHEKTSHRAWKQQWVKMMCQYNRGQPTGKDESDRGKGSKGLQLGIESSAKDSASMVHSISPGVKRWRLGDSVPVELQGALSLPELSPVSLALSHAVFLPVSFPPSLSRSLGLLLDLAAALFCLSSHISSSLSESFISSSWTSRTERRLGGPAGGLPEFSIWAGGSSLCLGVFGCGGWSWMLMLVVVEGEERCGRPMAEHQHCIGAAGQLLAERVALWDVVEAAQGGVVWGQARWKSAQRFGAQKTLLLLSLVETFQLFLSQQLCRHLKPCLRLWLDEEELPAEGRSR